MRVGLCLPQFGQSLRAGDSLARFAATAEELGYDSLWVADRLLTPKEPHDPYPGAEQPYPAELTRAGDPFVVWAVAAAATSRVRLGSCTLNAPYYHHVHLARALTTLDVVSGGRLDVGLGLGWMRDEYQAAGLEWRERGSRLDDILDFLRTWWNESQVTHHSRHVQVDDALVGLRPLQPGGPPVYLGGFSPAALRRAGRRAAGWLTIGRLPRDVNDRFWAAVRDAAEQSGRDPGTLRRVVRVNATPGSSVDDLAADLGQHAREGADEAFVDLTFAIPDPGEALQAARQLIDRVRGLPG
jgi:probable F420-dependent oxidoreductase